MVLQIKSESTILVKDLGFEIAFQSGNKRENVQLLSTSKSREPILETMIEIHEYQMFSVGISAQFISNEVKLTFSDVEKEVTLSKEQPFHILYHPSEDDVFPWTSGTVFLYELHFENRVYYGVIKVIPHQLSEKQFYVMATFLERELEGLTRNYFKETTQYLSVENQMIKSQFDLINWLRSSFSKIVSALMSIESDSQLNLKPFYKLERQLGQLDQRSIKWQTINHDPSNGTGRFYNRKYKVNIDTPENQWVKFRTREIIKKIDGLILLLNEEVDVTRQILVSLEHQIQERDAEKLFGTNRGITTKDEQLERNYFYGKKKEVEKAREKMNRRKDIYNEMLRYKQRLQYILLNPFWNQVNGVRPKRYNLSTQKGQIMFRKIWMECEKTQVNSSLQQGLKKEPIFQPTAKLYEYFAYISIIKQLINNGFYVNKDTLANQLQQGYLHSELTQGTTVSLVNEDVYLDIVYDKEVEHRSKDAIQNDTYFFSKFRKKQPDIRIDLYHIFQELKLYHSSMIVEVKYRPYRNIYSEHGNTKTMEQMNEYIGIKYFCPIRKTYMNRIHDVLCLYPGTNEKQGYSDTEAGKFIPFYPSNDGIVGLDVLHDLFKKWLLSTGNYNGSNPYQ